MSVATAHELEHKADTARLGFWLYLMTDLMLFAAFFATYMILRHGTAGGPAIGDIVSLPYVLIETILLLTSSYTCALASLSLAAGRVREFGAYFGVTVALGIGFLGMELYEFAHLIGEGHGPQASAFLSGFFSLLGLHGLHIAFGILWALVLVWLWRKRGLNANFTRRFSMFAIFWHFLDLVWIGIFTIVFVLGVL